MQRPKYLCKFLITNPETLEFEFGCHSVREPLENFCVEHRDIVAGWHEQYNKNRKVKIGEK